MANEIVKCDGGLEMAWEVAKDVGYAVAGAAETYVGIQLVVDSAVVVAVNPEPVSKVAVAANIATAFLIMRDGIQRVEESVRHAYSVITADSANANQSVRGLDKPRCAGAIKKE